jgi:hypothetical protein
VCAHVLHVYGHRKNDLCAMTQRLIPYEATQANSNTNRGLSIKIIQLFT